MPTAQTKTTPEDPEVFTDLITALGAEGVLVVTALGLILLGSTDIGRKVMRACMRRLSRYVRISLWGARLGIGYRLASRLQKERWDGMVTARKLPGLVRGKIKRSPTGLTVHLRLGGSLDLETVVRNTGQLEAGLGLRRGSTRVKPVTRADKALLHIVLRDPLAKPIEWVQPTRPVRLADPIKLSVTPFGDSVELDIKQRVGIFGTSGSGKSCVQRLIGAHVVQAVDADLEIWDLKFGTESQHYEGKAHRVTTVPEAVARVEWLLEKEFPRRAALMAQRGTSTWVESPDNRALVLMVDEGNVLTREFSDEQLKRFFRVAEQGRALGCYIVWATQFPKATNLPTELRSQLNVRICLKLLSSEESKMVFKDETNQGWEPHKLQGVGWLLIKSDAHREPEESRAVWLSEKRFQKVAATTSVPQPQEPVSRPLPPRPAHMPTVHLVDRQPLTQEPVEAVVPAQVSRPRISVEPTPLDGVRAVLAFAFEPMGVREIARILKQNPGTTSRYLNKLVALGEITADADKKYTLVLAPADRADYTKGTEA